MSNTSEWSYVWVCHLIRHAKPVTALPFGWCVYREAIDWD